jgi:hypothetical protein
MKRLKRTQRLGNALVILLFAGLLASASAQSEETESVIVSAKGVGHLIAKHAPLGVQGTLANARMAETKRMGAAKEHLAALLPQILASEDAMEGMISFTQLRETAFKVK